jgi:hypothetical protein
MFLNLQSMSIRYFKLLDVDGFIGFEGDFMKQGLSPSKIEFVTTYDCVVLQNDSFVGFVVLGRHCFGQSFFDIF